MEPAPQDSDLPIPVSDLWKALRRNSYKILFSSLAIGLTAMGLAGIRTPKYVAEASFHDKGNDSGSAIGGLSAMLGGLVNTPQDATIPLFKSKRLWKPLVKKYGLHTSIQEVHGENPRYTHLKNNLKVELAYLQQRAQVVLPEPHQILKISNAFISNEAPVAYKVEVFDEGNFALYDRNDNVVTQGFFGEQMDIDGNSFTITPLVSEELSGKSFYASLSPVDLVAENLAKGLEVKTDKDGEKMLKLSYSHPSRTLASALVNDLMAEFRHYLDKQHDKLADSQLEYLNKRKNESSLELETLITEYAVDLARDYEETGIIESEKELGILLHEKVRSEEKLVQIDLQLNRLSGLDPSNGAHLESLAALPKLPQIVHESLSEINSLKQKRDRLHLVLDERHKGSNVTLNEEWLESQAALLEEHKSHRQHAHALKTKLLAKNTLPPPAQILTEAPKELELLYTRLYEQELAQQGLSPRRQGLISYLDHYIHQSQVQEHLIHERIVHQRETVPELQSIDLDSGTQLYMSLMAELTDLESEIRQYTFMLDQVKDTNFDLSSLSGSLKDPVSQEIIRRYSVLSMGLKDHSIRSEKEQQRIREEQDPHRLFLLGHLEQTHSLLQLRKDFLEERVVAIQEVMFDLIQQQVGIAEKHVSEYAVAYIAQLDYEKSFIQKALNEIDRRLSAIPLHWATEQMIRYQAQLNGKVVEEVSKLVETKNISHNLETVLSVPIDAAVSPLLPKRPHLLLFGVLGAVLGFGVSAGYLLIRAVSQGLPASRDSLQLMGEHVAGTLPYRQRHFKPQSQQSQMDSLRRLAAHFSKNCTSSQRLLLLTGVGTNYSEALAELLQSRSKKTAVVTARSTKETAPQKLSVLPGELFDTIEVCSHYALGETLLKALTSPEFLSLEKGYDAVLIHAPLSAASAEAEGLIPLVEHCAVSIYREPIRNLTALWPEEKQPHCSFIILR